MKKYNIIYADPAWSFGDRLRSSKKIENKEQYLDLELHYHTMKTKDICNLKVN